MERFIKKAAIILTLVSATTVVFADRGAGKKSNKVKTNLNINTTANSLKSSILANYKNGLSYKGSFSINKQTTGSSIVSGSTLMTFQKGNTTYIMPYKNKMAVAEMKPGYAGVKLIIRSNK
jgi:hypothetical protein